MTRVPDDAFGTDVAEDVVDVATDDNADIIVVGAGPAGLAAATELAVRGSGCGIRRVVVLEREREAGGIPRHCAHSPFGWSEFRRLRRGPAHARALVDRAVAAGVEIRTGVSVMALEPGPCLTVTSDDGVARLAARRVLLCTGIREGSRVARGIGGTRPGGILSTAALQDLARAGRPRPFARPLIHGSELVSFSALVTCRGQGMRPVAMVEPGPRAVARHPSALLPRLLGVPLLTGTDVVAVEGRERVEAVVLRRAADGLERRVAADGLIVSGRFRPEATLLHGSHLVVDPGTGGPEVDQYGRCSDPTFFAAGNLLRPAESAGWSWREGRAIGRAMAHDLASGLPDREGGLRVRGTGDALAWILPQRLVARDSAAALPPALPALQLRVDRRVRGRLHVALDGRRIASRTLSALPERRVSLPLSLVPEGALTETVTGAKNGPLDGLTGGPTDGRIDRATGVLEITLESTP